MRGSQLDGRRRHHDSNRSHRACPRPDGSRNGSLDGGHGCGSDDLTHVGKSIDRTMTLGPARLLEKLGEKAGISFPSAVSQLGVGVALGELWPPVSCPQTV